MVVRQTLRGVRVDSQKGRDKVKEVINDPAFQSVKDEIKTIVQRHQPRTQQEEEEVRQSAILDVMDREAVFALAVSQKLLSAFRAGELD